MEDARLSAETNGISSCQFLTGSVEEHAPQVISKEKVHTFIIDPPRKGCSESVIKNLTAITTGTSHLCLLQSIHTRP